MLTFASVAMVSMQVSTNKFVNSTLDDRKAELLAQAGVAEAVAALRAGNSGAVGTLAAPVVLGSGLFWVESTDLGGNQVRLQVTAAVGSGRSALDVVVNSGGDMAPLFASTLNSDEQLTLNEGVVSDSYDSSLGSYASQVVGVMNGHPHAELSGDMSSNSNIVLNARASVLGDATPGPGSSVSFGTDGFVSGSTVPNTQLFTFPPIDVPAVASTGDLIVPNSGAVTIPSGNHAFGSLSIGKLGQLKIEGPANVVVDDFAGIKDSRLWIDATGGPVSIYVKSSYFHDNGFEAHPVPGSPMAVGFFIDCVQDIVFPSNSQVRGAYYAPKSSIQFTSGNEAWGSFAGKRVEMSSGMSFHYDTALLDHWEADTNQGEDELGLLLWTKAEVTPDVLRTQRGDPFELLGVDRGALPSPSEAWIP